MSDQLIEFAGQVVRALPRDLGQDTMQGWISNLESLRQALRKALAPTNVFPVWKTITLGTYKSASALQKALKSGGYQVSGWAKDLMSRPDFTLATKQVKVNLYRVTGKELGFQNARPLREIYARAAEYGLKPCPAEAGPLVRLGYPEQPQGEVVTMAMEPVTGSGGYLRLFYVDRGFDERWLDTGWSSPGDVWNPEYEFVFAGS
ncbi:MAG: hypothetical protein UX77_C0003G0033 [Parcubacteria group bacterium GW2011_GWA1_47_11]|uniref:Uncharacterized protein n=1 Tax=Candidatus Colwellbacteria bacterium GWA2_46_10 TaxID=1797684 RepID=A0A1G1YVY8_9BACT|nr:MAG: hypothetical protein UX29_C0001G0020 [Parcubacteria group bacterium GW2011_GWA2_46_10]KKU56155.1 MAG: hypothetical protein UX77_C0003G0033 [Parcubacteria group bacterium GW2011_GWA1_47_11]OGY56545.1 MAG: hypothetical protein A2119_01360 [Candidatus Colwellbacteria bacterium GWA2_46_10]